MKKVYPGYGYVSTNMTRWELWGRYGDSRKEIFIEHIPLHVPRHKVIIQETINFGPRWHLFLEERPITHPHAPLARRMAEVSGPDEDDEEEDDDPVTMTIENTPPISYGKIIAVLGIEEEALRQEARG
jgi:hypothetical protein